MGRIKFAFLFLLLAAAFAFLPAGEASGARYTVSQCGWHVGHDAGWFDTSADKFLRSSYCMPPASTDSFDGVHLTSETRGSVNSVGGTKFARWRWQAPAGTGIFTIHGQRWHVLKDGFQHRIGAVTSSGFTPFQQYQNTDTVKRDFYGTFSPLATAVESRLLCARPEGNSCSADAGSKASLRGLTITLDDWNPPGTWIGGALAGDSWMNGTKGLDFSAIDAGSGLRFSQTLVDGNVRAETEHSCSKAFIAGQWRATKMQPCATSASGSHQVNTAVLSDGPHLLRQCALDFANNRACSAEQTIRTDNTAPAAPRALSVAGGDGWHRQNGFDLQWQNPDQGPAAPIFANVYRVIGKGFDSGPRPATGQGPISGVALPDNGEFKVSVWLIDMAGNSNQSNAAEATLRRDEVAPKAFFEEPSEHRPELLRLSVSDEHSGIAGGRISYRRQGDENWNHLPSELKPGDSGLALEAGFPSDRVPAGEYEFEAAVLDRAGNATITRSRGNGSPLILPAPTRSAATLAAKLIGQGRSGSNLTVGYRERARIEGRLADPHGNGLAGQVVEIRQIPASGSREEQSTQLATTGGQGFFSFTPFNGPNRRILVSFAGSERLSAANIVSLEIKRRGKLSLRAKPGRLETGQRLRLRGRVKSPMAWWPARGSLVAIQYFEKKTRRWRPVLVTRSNRRGIFRAKYRFRYITGKARIRMRARLLPNPRFPYEPAASKAVTIRVSG